MGRILFVCLLSGWATIKGIYGRTSRKKITGKMSRRRHRRLAQQVLAEARARRDLPDWARQHLADIQLPTPVRKKRPGLSPADRRRQSLSALYKGVRLAGLRRPAEAGDLCWKCGTAVVYRVSKSKPHSQQKFAYKGFLWCNNCKTLYHCEEFKYRL
jgi:hypothetical protein